MNKIKNRQTPNVPDLSFPGRQSAVATGSVQIFCKRSPLSKRAFCRCWQDLEIRAGLSQQNVGRVHPNPQAAKQSQRAVYFLQSKQLTLMFRHFTPKR